jgi:hypothetical protein
MSDEINGLHILKSAKKQDGQFVLEELDEKIAEIILAIRKNPQKGGSLNIQMKFEPQTDDAEMIITTVDITNVKKPNIPPRAVLTYTTKSGKLSSKDPNQGELFDNAKDIDTETGEIRSISDAFKNMNNKGDKK